jgi:hypothetical protein
MDGVVALSSENINQKHNDRKVDLLIEIATNLHFHSHFDCLVSSVELTSFKNGLIENRVRGFHEKRVFPF